MTKEEVVYTVQEVKILDAGLTCELELDGNSLTWNNRTTCFDTIQLPLSEVSAKGLWVGASFLSTSYYDRHGYFRRSEHQLDKLVTKAVTERAERLQRQRGEAEV